MSGTMDASGDALTTLTHDHRQVEHLYQQLQSGPGNVGAGPAAAVMDKARDAVRGGA